MGAADGTHAYYLAPFSKLKRRGHRFDTIEEIRRWPFRNLKSVSKKRWQKCVASEGQCFEGDDLDEQMKNFRFFSGFHSGTVHITAAGGIVTLCKVCFGEKLRTLCAAHRAISRTDRQNALLTAQSLHEMIAGVLRNSCVAREPPKRRGTNEIE